MFPKYYNNNTLSTHLPTQKVATSQVFNLCESVKICRISADLCRFLQICRIFTDLCRYVQIGKKDQLRNTKTSQQCQISNKSVGDCREVSFMSKWWHIFLQQSVQICQELYRTLQIYRKLECWIRCFEKHIPCVVTLELEGSWSGIGPWSKLHRGSIWH